YLNTINKTWVLSRLAIEMEEMPRSYTRFYVETWVESAMRFFTNRNFKVTDVDNGKVSGYGRSVWAMIDTETRQPADLFSVKDSAIKEYVETEKACPIAKSSRVKMGDDAALVRVIDTNYSDIDINGHVNSVKYIEHVLDLWDLAWYREHPIHRLEIAYVAESHQGDKLCFYREQDAEGAFNVRIAKEDGTETCRCKVVF
ncbi:MAG: acyl-[Prevotella sp.]|nr:acyl-[acyl-carrier-protein] thioesterase [Prevotella sp.]